MLKANGSMQDFVNAFIKKYQLQTDAKTRYIDVASEIGELGKEILVSTDYGKMDLDVNAQMADEMGDCLFSILALCCELDIDAQEALAKALAKYEKRFAKKGDIGSAL